MDNPYPFSEAKEKQVNFWKGLLGPLVGLDLPISRGQF